MADRTGTRDCECLDGCPFFNDRMETLPDAASLLKARYCRADNRQCARHMVFRELGREKIPADLYPNHILRAREILQEARKSAGDGDKNNPGAGSGADEKSDKENS